LKLLLFHSKEFWYIPYSENTASPQEKETITDTIVAFIHVEEQDKGREDLVSNAAQNVKWLVGKNNVNNIVLHSFAHLSSSKADPAFAESMILSISEKLKNKKFNVHLVPFGKFYEFSLHVFGPSLAKVFKEV
jgi:hypothetical protein